MVEAEVTAAAELEKEKLMGIAPVLAKVSMVQLSDRVRIDAKVVAAQLLAFGIFQGMESIRC